MSVTDAENFFEGTRAARKVMMLDLGFLGDTVHLLPALWMVRQAYPQAELHVAVAAHITSLMDCVPWVDRAWGYMRFPRHATLRENLSMVHRLRRAKFDVVINLNGSDRSSWLTFLSGAPARLGRRPGDGGPLFWNRLFTDHISHPFTGEPVYLQLCHCLEKAGFPFGGAEFHAHVDPASLRVAEISENDSYFHLSPFTTADSRELPPAQLAELVRGLADRFSDLKLAVSCAPAPREQEKLAEFLALLPQRPWRVFAGNLNLVQLTAVIQHSRLHFCGNTGSLHLAVMTRTPTTAWFQSDSSSQQWFPRGKQFRVLVGKNEPGARFLSGIATGDLVAAAGELISASTLPPAA
jgi:ADP-heptose:LPS heptosyltransferase